MTRARRARPAALRLRRRTDYATQRPARRRLHSGVRPGGAERSRDPIVPSRLLEVPAAPLPTGWPVEGRGGKGRGESQEGKGGGREGEVEGRGRRAGDKGEGPGRGRGERGDLGRRGRGRRLAGGGRKEKGRDGRRRNLEEGGRCEKGRRGEGRKRNTTRTEGENK